MPPSGYAQVFSEDFNGSSLPAGWNLGYYFNTGVPSSAVTVSGGAAHLTWTRGGHTDISISSTATFRYGYFEVRMKWNVTPGAWPAFWMIPSGGAGLTGEIDIFEGQGSDPTYYYGTVHEWNGSSHLWASNPNAFNLPGTDYSQYHTYAILWTPGGNFTWYFDGVAINTISAANSPAASIWDSENVFLILSMQMGNNWSVGNLSGVSANSFTNDIDYVKVYQQTTTTGQPSITSFSASPSSGVNPGDTVTLSWTQTGATALEIDNGVGDVTGLTSKTVTLFANTNYTLKATNAVGIVTATALVSIAGQTTGSGTTGGTTTGTSSGGVTGTPSTPGAFPPVITTFTPSATTTTSGTSVTLTFAISGGTSAYVSPDVGTVNASSGTVSVSPTTTTTYTLISQNENGAATQSITITVDGPNAENIRYHQIRRNDRHGNKSYIQMSDGTGIQGHVAIYDADGNITDGKLAISSIPSAGSVGPWIEEVPAGTLDSSNVTFTLTFTPIFGSLTLFLNIQQREGTDFTISGGTITFAVAPKFSDTGWFQARYQR